MNRRELLATTGLVLGGLAGCTGSNDSENQITTSDDSTTTTSTSTDTTTTKEATTTTTTTEEPTTTTTEPPETSEYYGPTSENPKYVDLQYRNFKQQEIEAVKNKATSPGYRDLFRDIDAYTDKAVHYRGAVGQVMEGGMEDHYYLFIGIDGSSEKILYASWVGDRVLRGDRIEFWARVLGTESYQTGGGSQITVPALAIADLNVTAQ